MKAHTPHLSLSFYIATRKKTNCAGTGDNGNMEGCPGQRNDDAHTMNEKAALLPNFPQMTKSGDKDFFLLEGRERERVCVCVCVYTDMDKISRKE